MNVLRPVLLAATLCMGVWLLYVAATDIAFGTHDYWAAFGGMILLGGSVGLILFRRDDGGVT